MRSNVPIPGNPWPHDMVLRVEDRPHALLEMLWVREADGLDVGADIPPLLVSPARMATDAATRADWTARWPAVWQAALLHATDATTAPAQARLHEERATLTQDERIALLGEIVGPTWGSEVGREAFETPEYRAWQESLPRPVHGGPLEAHPERRDLEAVIPAWEAGLTTIVQLPVRGALGRRTGRHGLLVSEATRADSAAYRRALAAFVH